MPTIPLGLIEELGFSSLAHVEHVMEQVPGLMEEAIKRIKYAPFGEDGMFCGHSGGKDSVLVRYIVDQAIGDHVLTVHTPKPEGVRNAVHPFTKEFLYALDRPVLNIPVEMFHDMDVMERFNMVTQIDGTRAAEAERRDGRDVGVVVRGEERSRADMPLYLEDGLFGLQFVYPIFDWTDQQVWAAIFLYDIPFTKEYYVQDECINSSTTH